MKKGPLKSEFNDVSKEAKRVMEETVYALLGEDSDIAAMKGLRILAQKYQPEPGAKQILLLALHYRLRSEEKLGLAKKILDCSSNDRLFENQVIEELMPVLSTGSGIGDSGDEKLFINVALKAARIICAHPASNLAQKERAKETLDNSKSTIEGIRYQEYQRKRAKTKEWCGWY